jgi:hypothetical protein
MCKYREFIHRNLYEYAKFQLKKGLYIYSMRIVRESVKAIFSWQLEFSFWIFPMLRKWLFRGEGGACSVDQAWGACGR